MQTRVVEYPDLEGAIISLQKGDPIVIPTETVYGLAAPLFDEQAVKKIFTIKGRPSDNPLIAHISSLEQAELLAVDLPKEFYLLARHFWPGPLTLVVKRKTSVPALVSAGHLSIAIRMPSHQIAARVINEVGPLAIPSANLSGRPSPTCVEDVLEDLDGKVPFVVDGGRCSVGLESTVISLFSDKPTLLRPGKITAREIEEILQVPVQLPSPCGPILSPGMKYRHYAPKAPIRLVYRGDELVGPFILPTQQTLYSALREADRKGAQEIQIYCDENVQKDAALMNRLLRAAGQIQ